MNLVKKDLFVGEGRNADQFIITCSKRTHMHKHTHTYTKLLILSKKHLMSSHAELKEGQLHLEDRETNEDE